MHSLNTLNHLHNNREAEKILASQGTKELHTAQEQKFQADIDAAFTKRENVAQATS